jgi:hypothetical protein
MWNKSFQEMGIPPGYGFMQLLFSPVALAIVVQTQSGEKNWRPERLYFRKIEADKYTPIGQPGELVSQENPFLHPAKPLVAFNCLKHKFSLDAQGEERHSADWDSLNLYNLQSGTEVEQVKRETLTLPPGIIRGWITTLVGFSDMGLFVTAGLSKDASRTDYVVAELDLSKHFLKPIASLPATFM